MKSMQSKNHKFVKKPWGGYQVLEEHPGYWLKKLFIEKGEQISLQSHNNRSEIWVVLEGKIRVQKDNDFYILQKGGYILIKIDKKEKHRIYGLTKATVLEVAFGQPTEEDIIRYKDKYGRER